MYGYCRNYALLKVAICCNLSLAHAASPQLGREERLANKVYDSGSGIRGPFEKKMGLMTRVSRQGDSLAALLPSGFAETPTRLVMSHAPGAPVTAVCFFYASSVVYLCSPVSGGRFALTRAVWSVTV